MTDQEYVLKSYPNAEVHGPVVMADTEKTIFVVLGTSMLQLGEGTTVLEAWANVARVLKESRK